MKKIAKGSTLRGGWGMFGAAVVIAAILAVPVAPRSSALQAVSPMPMEMLSPYVVGSPFEAKSATLSAGETLSQLLERTEISTEARAEIQGRITAHRDPRRLQPGLEVRWTENSENGELRRVEVPLNADSTLVLIPQEDGWNERLTVVPVEKETTVLAGNVETSLYSALVDAGEGSTIPVEERRAVVDLLAEKIFAWQIDFSRDLRTGDRFWILYDREVRPDGTARSNNILGVQFEVGGRLHEAYRYEGPNGAIEYYDRSGESLKRMFLRAPVEFRRISSVFNPNRFHPILQTSRPHNGVDYAASSGTPIRSTAAGTVSFSGRKGGYGNFIEINHGRGYTTRYAHLQGFAKGIRPGARVQQGQLIGYVGQTGLATGPHLHYELRQAGSPVNPEGVKYRTAAPVSGAHRNRFLSVASMVASRIDAEKSDSHEAGTT